MPKKNFRFDISLEEWIDSNKGWTPIYRHIEVKQLEIDKPMDIAKEAQDLIDKQTENK